LELVTASAALGIAVQRSVQLVAFGLRASDALTRHDPNVPSAIVQLKVDKEHRLTLRSVRAAYKRWVLANGLRDCVESLGEVLEAARFEATLWDFGGLIVQHEDGKLSLGATIEPEVWNRRVVAARDRFDRLPLPDKIAHLHDRLRVERPALTESILSISAARNCLTHRQGRVGTEDLTRGADALVVTWRRWRLEGKRAGRRRHVVRLGTALEANTVVSIRLVEVTRRFRLGQRIAFTAREYVEIATTFALFGGELQERIRQMQLSRFHAQGAEVS
jgi:hypothetical protein